MSDQMRELMDKLKMPFDPKYITWKPGSVKKDGTAALALAYADLRAYQNRLDELLGINWSVTYQPWGDRIICHLTIEGITRSSTGEPDSQSEKQEMGGTVAEAQAMKRACAMFSLGRYLYSLPSVWADFDNAKKTFTPAGKAKLDAIIVNHYKRWKENNVVAELADHLDADVVVKEVQADPVMQVTQPDPIAQPVQGRDPEFLALHAEFQELGESLYADKWAEVCCHNVLRITNQKTSASLDLTDQQIRKLIGGMETLQKKRIAEAVEAAAQAEGVVLKKAA